MRKISQLLIISNMLMLSSCFVYEKKAALEVVLKKKILNSSLTSLNIANNQVTISGSGFSNITTVKIQGANVNTTLNISSLSDSQIVATATSSLALLVGGTFDLIIGTADAQATYAITFTLQNGAVAANHLARMGAQNGDFLKYTNAGWVPSPMGSSQTYQGLWNASNNVPDLTSGSFNAGDYYIVSTGDTTTVLGFACNPGDWVMYNDTTTPPRWDKIATTSISGSGTAHYIPYYSSPNALTDSPLYVSGNNVGIGSITPGSALDVKGVLRLSGATSGFVGLAPAAAAGSTVYTLPATEGASGQVLTTNGVASTPTLSWTTPATNAGTVTSITSANSDIAVSGTSAIPVLTLNSGTNAGQVLKLSVNSKLPALDGSLLTAITATTNANLTGDVTSVGNATTIGALKVTNGMLAGSIDLTTKVTGVLPLANGGSGVNSGVTGGIPYFNSTSSMASSLILNLNEIVLGGGGSSPPAGLGSTGTAGYILTSGGVGLAPNWTQTIPVANGGTGAGITPVNGGVVYTNASAMAVSAAGSTGQILRSSGAGAPTWSTTTYPASVGVNNLLFGSSANVVGEITTANSSILATNGSGVPSWNSVASTKTLLGYGTAANLNTGVTSGTIPVLNNAPSSLSLCTMSVAGFDCNTAIPTSEISSLNAATKTNTIDNLNFDQTWNWSTATTQIAQTKNGNALTTGGLLTLSSSSAALNSTNGLLNVSNTGASTTGVLAQFKSNSTANSGMSIFNNGKVGIGMASPVTTLDVAGPIRSTTSVHNEGIGVFSGTNTIVSLFNDYGHGRITLGSSGGGTGIDLGPQNPTQPNFIIPGSSTLGIGTNSPQALLDVTVNRSATPSGTVGGLFAVGSTTTTFTDNATAASGTRAASAFTSITSPIFAASNTGVVTTNAYGLYVGGPPKAGTNQTLTNSTGLFIASSAVNPTGTVANSYGMQVNAPTGATKNYAASFMGGNVGIGTTTPLMNLSANIGATPYLVFNGNNIGFGGVGANWGTRFSSGSMEAYGTNFTFGAYGNPGSSQFINFYTQGTTDPGGVERMIITSTGRVGIGTNSPGYMLDVNGSIAAVGALQAHSDRRLKKNIVTVDNSLDKILAIKGVYFDWRKDEFPGIHFEGGRQMGVIAQDVEKVFPEAVAKNGDGIRSVAYTMLIAPLIEAVKELYAKFTGHDEAIASNARAIASVKAEAKAENVELRKKLEALRVDNELMKAKLAKIEKFLNKSN
jgi:hypothetical protein